MDEKEAVSENIEEPQKEAILENIEEPQATSFDAEKIVSSAVDENGKRFYQVRWVTYSWELEESFAKAEHMVKKFWEEYEKMQKENQEKVVSDTMAADVEKQQQQLPQQQQQQQQQQMQLQQQRIKRQQQQGIQPQKGKQQQRQQQSQPVKPHQKDKKEQDDMPLFPIRGVKFKSPKTDEFVQAIEETIKNVVTSFKENQTSALAALLPTMVNQENMNNVSTSDNEETPPDDEIDFQAGPMPSGDSQSGDVPRVDSDAGIVSRMVKGKGAATIVVGTRAEALGIMRELVKPARFIFYLGWRYSSNRPRDLSTAKVKVLWETEFIEYTGIPFVALDRRYHRCAHGGGKLKCKDKRIHHFPCPATVKLLEYVFFPGEKISFRKKRLLNGAGQRVHELMESGDLTGAVKRVVVYIPTPTDHNHPIEEPFVARCTYAHTKDPALKGLPGHTYTAACRVCYETRKATGWKPKKKYKKKKKEEIAL